MIDLNYEIPEMRKEMIRSMQHWVVEFDIDGFRCDMARTVPIDFWVEARRECDALNPLFWLAECEIPEYHEVFDVTYGWEAMRGMDKYLKGEGTRAEIIPVLARYSGYPIGSKKLLFTSNHDENTYWGTEYEKYGVAAAAMAVFSCTWPGIPLVYSGQEKPNKKRLSFFEKDFIDWKGDVALHGFYEAMLRFRKRNKALQESASVIVLPSQHPDVLVYLCRRQQDKVLVFLNFSQEKARLQLNHPALRGTYRDLFSAGETAVERRYEQELDGGGYVVLHVTSENAGW